MDRNTSVVKSWGKGGGAEGGESMEEKIEHLILSTIRTPYALRHKQEVLWFIEQEYLTRPSSMQASVLGHS